MGYSLEPCDRIGRLYDFGDFVSDREPEQPDGGRDVRRHHQEPKTVRPESRLRAYRPIAESTPPPHVMRFATVLRAEFNPGELTTLDEITERTDTHRKTAQSYTAALAKAGLLPVVIQHKTRWSRNEVNLRPTPEPVMATESERCIRDYQRSRWARPLRNHNVPKGWGA